MDDTKPPLWKWLCPVLFTGLATTLLAWLGNRIEPAYGLGIFALVPVASGFLAAALCRLFGRETRPDALGAAAMGQVAAGLGLILWKMEGLICLLMALPLALPLGLLGAWIGHAVLVRRPTLAAMAVLPLCLSGPTFDLFIGNRIPPVTSSVSTDVVVNAPPERVWPNVVEFPPLPQPHEWYFRSGISYPLRAHIDGRGPGAIRYCEFTTGPFVEPIVEWRKPSLLRFDVTANPAPLKELSPFDIHPPHLDGWFRSTRGQFHLQRLPGNRTRLTGTTWYTQTLQPAAYWNLWTGAIIHRIHQRVLEHIRSVSETRVE